MQKDGEKIQKEKGNVVTFSLINKKRISSGSYGIVYRGEDKVKNKWAVKRNLVEANTSFITVLREIHYLGKFRKHPHIITLRGISLNSPFEEPLSPHTKPYREDPAFVLMEHATCDLREWISTKSPKRDKSFHPPLLKLAMTQILLGLEYIHGQGIIHRDLKPENILWCEDKMRMKIADLGMCCAHNRKRSKKSGCQTPRYRAPEVYALWTDYNYKIDIWSLGCIFFEMISGTPLMYDMTKDSSPTREFCSIISKVPVNPTRAEIDYLFKHKNRGNYMTSISQNNIVIPEKNSSLIDQAGLRSYEIERLEKIRDVDCHFSIKEFFSFLWRLLVIKPEDRPTCEKIITEYKFFTSMKSYVSELRNKLTPITNSNSTFNAPGNEVSRSLSRIIFERYESFVFSYGVEMLFQTVSMVYRYVDYFQKGGKNLFGSGVYCGSFKSMSSSRDDSPKEELRGINKFLEDDIENLEYVILSIAYMAYKLSHDEFVKEGKTFQQFLNIIKRKQETSSRNHEEFEAFLITGVFKYIVFKDTPYEFMEKSDTNLSISENQKDLLKLYIELEKGTHHLSTPLERLESRKTDK